MWKKIWFSFTFSFLIFKGAKFSFVHITDKQQTRLVYVIWVCSFHYTVLSSFFPLCLAAFPSVVNKSDFTAACHRTARVDTSMRVDQSQDLHQWSAWSGLHSHTGKRQVWSFNTASKWRWIGGLHFPQLFLTEVWSKLLFKQASKSSGKGKVALRALIKYDLSTR